MSTQSDYGPGPEPRGSQNNQNRVFAPCRAHQDAKTNKTTLPGVARSTGPAEQTKSRFGWGGPSARSNKIRASNKIRVSNSANIQAASNQRQCLRPRSPVGGCVGPRIPIAGVRVRPLQLFADDRVGGLSQLRSKGTVHVPLPTQTKQPEGVSMGIDCRDRTGRLE